MSIADSIGQDVLGEGLVCASQRARLVWQGILESLGGMGRRWLPNWALTNLGQIVQHIVQHAMPLGSHSLPIAWGREKVQRQTSCRAQCC